VHEFRLFHKELKEFFNASSLEERLDRLRPQLPTVQGVRTHRYLIWTMPLFVLAGFPAKQPTTLTRIRGCCDRSQLIDDFFSRKHHLGASPHTEYLVDTLASLTALRIEMAALISQSIHSGASDDDVALRQQIRLTEMDLEKYAFVLTSQLEGHLGGGALVPGAPMWGWALSAAQLAVQHIGLSRFEEAECDNIAADLEALATKARTGGGLALHEGSADALRIISSLERARRLAEDYTQCILDVFADRAWAMGNALGVDEHISRVHSESEVRASMTFQLSKLCTVALKAARDATGAGAWDALVAGTAEGTLIEVLQPCEESNTPSNPFGMKIVPELDLSAKGLPWQAFEYTWVSVLYARVVHCVGQGC
jgi:phosphoglucan,water dikinase